MLMILDICGLVFGVTGAILVGRLNYKGFLFFMLGSISHGTMGLLQGNYGLMLTSLVFICIDIYYYNSWRKRL